VVAFWCPQIIAIPYAAIIELLRPADVWCSPVIVNPVDESSVIVNRVDDRREIVLRVDDRWGGDVRRGRLSWGVRISSSPARSAAA